MNDALLHLATTRLQLIGSHRWSGIWVVLTSLVAAGAARLACYAPPVTYGEAAQWTKESAVKSGRHRPASGQSSSS